MPNSSPTRSLEVPAPNGFHLHVPGTGEEPYTIHANEKAIVSFVALSGTFSLDQIKLLKNQVYFKTLEASAAMEISEKSSSTSAAELLIFCTGSDALKGDPIPFSDSPSNLSLPALKIISRRPADSNHSAAAAWMNQQVIRIFIYSIGFQNDRKRIRLSYGEIKEFQHRLEGINTRQHCASAFAQLSQRLYRRPPKKLEREKIMESAMEELIHSSKTLDLLARESGYHSEEFFITAFKKHFGISPGRLRTNLRGLHGTPFS